MQTYTINTFADSINDVGLSKGSNLMIHSSLMHLGLISDTKLKEYPNKIFECISQRIGEEGTICVPAAFYHYGSHKKPFHLENSPVSNLLGVLSKYVNKLPNSERSINPIFSVAAIGKHAKKICNISHGSAFGPNSAWDILFKMNAEILYIGCDLRSSTFLRYVEHIFGVPYLYNKLFNIPVYKNSQKIEVKITAPLRYSHCPAIYDKKKWKLFEDILKSKGSLKVKNIGNGKIMLVKMNDFFDEAINLLTKDFYFFLKEEPRYVEGNLPII